MPPRLSSRRRLASADPSPACAVARGAGDRPSPPSRLRALRPRLSYRRADAPVVRRRCSKAGGAPGSAPGQSGVLPEGDVRAASSRSGKGLIGGEVPVFSAPPARPRLPGSDMKPPAASGSGMFAAGRLPACGVRMSTGRTSFRPRYGTERGTFYFVDAEIEEEVPRPHLASVTLAPKQVLSPGLVISADLIQAELAAYIGDFRDSDFTWEVTETAPLVFSVPFPSAKLLRVCSHDFIRYPINKFLISVHAATAEPELVPPLEKVWVLVYVLPRCGLAAPQGGNLTHILKAISEPVGKLVTADAASFEDDGPARIEILCPTPVEIDGMFLIFYFGSRGRRLTFELESPASVDMHGPTPSADVPGDDGHDGDGGSSEQSSFYEEDVGDGGVPPAAVDGRRTTVSTIDGPSDTAGVASRVASGIEPAVLVGLPPFVSELVVLDGVEVLGGSSPIATTAADLEFTEADVLSVGMEVCPSSSPRSPGVVCYSRSPGSPSPTLGSPERVLPSPLDLGLLAVTPEAAGPKARGADSPVVSAR
ncbi:hypothetical protein ZWY2020_059735 [Hordeum vulgare]|nr:hypothetical protein ZWY2020_059735 [Hordeum vulgare]